MAFHAEGVRRMKTAAQNRSVLLVPLDHPLAGKGRPDRCPGRVRVLCRAT